MASLAKKINLLFLLLFFSFRLFATTLAHGPNTDVFPYNNLLVTEDSRIRIVNQRLGNIEISHDQGNTWQKIGKVVLPSTHTNDKAYNASKWSKQGTVAASAVNAIHIKVGTNLASDCGIVFSLLPQDLMQAKKNYTSYLSPDSSIYTDIKAGHGIFGGHNTPFVGNPVYLETANGLTPLPLNYQPQLKDTLMIKILRPLELPYEMIFENRFGGRIILNYGSYAKIIGMVLRPVSGVGRFLGSQYVARGRIRANHAGVIDISTAKDGLLGGIQIIPANHGMSKEMVTARTLSQWMVVGPSNVNDPSWENTAPLFSYFLRPSYDKDDLKSDDWKEKLSSRYLVLVQRAKDSDIWYPMPENHYSLDEELPKEAYRVLDEITAIKIVFPVYTH